MLKNTHSSYGTVQVYLHWLSALAVFGLFALGFWMVDLNYYSSWYKTAPHIHKSIGLLLLFATLFRIVWKLSQPKVEALSNNKLEALAGHVAHIALYALLLVVMTSGYLISTADGRGIDIFNWVTIPSLGELFADQEDIAGIVHEYAAYTIIALALLHALAALKHHFINKDQTLTRMTKFH